MRYHAHAPRCKPAAVSASLALALHTVIAATHAAPPLQTLGAASSPTPQYRLLHIGGKSNCSADGPCTKDTDADGNGRDFNYAITPDEADVLSAFSLLHLSPKRIEQVQLLEKHARQPLVKYTETQPVCGGSAGQDTPYVAGCNDTFNFETGGFRKDAMVYHAGNLTAPIGAGDTALSICMAVPFCCNHYAAPLVPSTANGSYSHYTGTTYVTFLRVGDELMKITAAEPATNPDPESPAACQTLTVARGLDGSVPAAAPQGAPVLAPVYITTPHWEGAGASGKLRYQADYGTFYAWSSLANFTVDAVQQLGYDGAWFDSFTPSEVKNGADTQGNKVSVWNVAAQRTYTRAEVYQAQQARLTRVWAAVKARLGYYPVIWANNFEGWFPDSHGGPGDRVFMLPAPGFRPFDGSSLESWTAGFDGPGCFLQTADVEKWAAVYEDETSWVARVNTLIDAARLNLSVAAMTGSAGCQSPLQTYLPVATRTKLDFLHYASFLLAVRGRGGTEAATSSGILAGTSAFFAEDTRGDGQARGMGVAKLWGPYTWAVGAPTMTFANVTQYANHNYYIINIAPFFQNGANSFYFYLFFLEEIAIPRVIYGLTYRSIKVGVLMLRRQFQH